jgi:hypothetical protein
MSAAPPPPPPPQAPAAPRPAPQLQAVGATLGGAAKADPAWGYMLTYECAPGTFEMTRATCETLAAAVTQERDPRTGVVTYAFTCVFGEGAEEHTPRHIGMLELFADSNAQANHLTENEGEVMVEMFQSSLQLVPGGATVINVNEDDKELQASLVSIYSYVDTGMHAYMDSTCMLNT